MKMLLGIDIGTTGTKTLLIREDGQILGHAYRPYALITPKIGRSEQKAEDWWQAVVETTREVMQEIRDPENVAAISLSLQGGTVVPTDADGNALRNAIVWNDIRCAEEFKAFEAEGGSGEYAYQTCGWHMSRSLPVLETRWIRDHEPEIFAKTKRILTVPDYISLKMTGTAAVDISDAGINQFCNIRKFAYEPKMMEFAGITEEMLPKIVKSGEVIGNLTEEAAQALGLTEKTVLVAGAHDQYAVAVGGGANHAGDVMIGSGTAWVVTGIGEKPAFDSGLSVSVSAVPGKWGTIFSLSTGGVCLDWARKNVFLGADPEKVSYDELNRVIPERKAAEDNLFFYPFLGIAGKGRRFSKGSFVGLDLSHDRFDMARAVMEGVVFETNWMMDSFEKPERAAIRLAGGAAKSPAWSAMIADITGLPVRIPRMPDLACVGAAVIAGYGAGIFSSVEEGSRILAVESEVITPDPGKNAMYREKEALYRKSAAHLGDLYGV